MAVLTTVMAVGILVALAASLLFSLESGAVKPEVRLQDIVRRGVQPLVTRDLPGTPEEPGEEGTKKERRSNGALTRAMAGALQQALQGKGYALRLEYRLRRSGARLQVGEFVTTQIVLGLILVLFAALLFNGEPLVLLVAGALGFWLPEYWLTRQRKQRLRSLEGQLADALAILANSLRSGHSFLQAMEVVSREMPDPIAKEFGLVLKETRVNIPLEEALISLQQRAQSPNLSLAVTAVLIQRQVGGNLSEVLDSIGDTIRDRIKLLGEIRTLTSMGRMSGWVVSLLPIGLSVALYALNPEYMDPLLHTPMGWVLLFIAAGMQMTGILVIQHMVRMEV